MLEVGRITKAHGLGGEVVVDLTTDRTVERTQPGAWFRLVKPGPAGADAPQGDGLTVVKARPFGKRWLFRFEGVDHRDQADQLKGMILQAEAVKDPEAIFVHQVIGKQLVDQHGVNHGPVVSVLSNPASDLIELGDGRLVPFTFVDGLEPATDMVRVTVPPGLLDDDSVGG